MSDWTDARNQIQARMLADSVSPEGQRLSTLEVTGHRYILAEANTHRVFSRNSASSRAIPVAKQVDKVRRTPAWPVEFGSNQKGMQAGPPLEGDALQSAKDVWEAAAESAIYHVEQLAELGVHKQVTNRLLEPFMWHTMIISATDWEGFWHQRCSPLAQPEIRVMAEAMKVAYDASEPTPLALGEWHTPLIQPEEDLDFWRETFLPYNGKGGRGVPLGWDGALEFRKRVSVARCARVSYLTHDGKRDIEADLDLYDRLVTADPPHWSPLEHVATPCPPLHYELLHDKRHLGNFTGFDQHRHEIEAAR